MTTDTGRHLGYGTPEIPPTETLANQQGPRSESRGQPPVDVGDPPDQRVEKRRVERYTRIPRS